MSDVLIVGGGVMGLWAAVMAVRAGLTVHLVERDRIGAGASGGLLGALMAHMPDRFDAKKQFQFQALVTLEDEIRALEAATGLSASYRRCGRLIPLARPHQRPLALRHQEGAARHWQEGGRSFEWRLLQVPPVSGWLAPEAAAEGVVLDTLAARLSPRGLLAVLAAHLRCLPQVRIEEGRALARLDPVARQAVFTDGTAASYGTCILSAGVGSFPLLDALMPGPVATGIAVKGQAALLDMRADPLLPLVFADGVYVVVHEDGRVAIGSTSEDEFDDAFSTDGKLDDLLARAARLVPATANVPVIERWAGLRPKAVGRDPMAGPVGDRAHLHVLTGGFKISFGIAHRLAAALLDGIVSNKPPAVPQSFLFEAHQAARSESPDASRRGRRSLR